MDVWTINKQCLPFNSRFLMNKLISYTWNNDCVSHEKKHKTKRIIMLYRNDNLFMVNSSLHLSSLTALTFGTICKIRGYVTIYRSFYYYWKPFGCKPWSKLFLKRNCIRVSFISIDINSEYHSFLTGPS